MLEAIKESYKEMKPMLDASHNKELSLYNEYICTGGMPAAILNYIEHDKNILKFEDDIYEVDFLINIDGDIIPIEVKASDNTSSASLNYYIKRYKPKYSIRLSTKNFGEINGMKSIPLYASFML